MTKEKRKKLLKENPEYETIEEYIQYLYDDERTEFSGLDLLNLSEIHELDRKALRARLESEGFKLQERKPKRPDDSRGFKRAELLSKSSRFEQEI